MKKELYKKVLFAIWPGRCHLCDMPTKRNLDLCFSCERKLPWIKGVICRYCGYILTGENCRKNDLIELSCCGKCLKKRYPYNKVCATFIYKSPIKELLQRLKFGNKLIYSYILSIRIASRFKDYYIDGSLPEVVIPVPLHRQRLKERGFNQALELLKPIAKKLEIKIVTNWVKRDKSTLPQARLAEDKRVGNLKAAFSVTRSWPKKPPKYVAIFDDVVTTGATVRSLCKMLRKAGVKKIDVWAIAKTSMTKRQ